MSGYEIWVDSSLLAIIPLLLLLVTMAIVGMGILLSWRFMSTIKDIARDEHELTRSAIDSIRAEHELTRRAIDSLRELTERMHAGHERAGNGG
jgi:predicted tellurium resistance membrane protein TerC